MPSDDDIAERKAAGKGLDRAGLAVLLAYTKNTLYDALVAADVPEDPYLLGRAPPGTSPRPCGSGSRRRWSRTGCAARSSSLASYAT